MAEHNSAFQINDILLDIAPENISINHTAQVKQYSPLRTRGTAKVRSPSSVVEVAVQTKFVGVRAINTQLRPLLAQLKLTPFCFIENQYLRDSLIGKNSGVQENMALVLQNLTVSTVEGLPDTFNVIFSFLWFNYKPYSKNFNFKKKLFESSQQNQSPAPALATSGDFTPFQLFYNNELSKTRPVSLLSSSLSLQGLEFALSVDELSPSVENADSEIDLAKLREFETEVTRFIHEAPDITQSLGTDATGDMRLNQYMGRLSGNVTLADVNEVNFAISQYAEQFKTIKPNDVRLSKILEGQKRIIQKVPTLSKNAWFPYPDLVTPNKLRGKSVKGEVNGKLYYRQRTLNTDSDLNLHSGIVATSITVNFNHKLAIIPLQGYSYPTAQSFGPSDIEFNVQFVCLDDDSNRRFTAFWNANQNALQYARSIPQNLLNILVDNELFALFGVRNVLLTAKRANTVQGQPGLHSHELVLTSNDFDISTVEQFVAQPTSYRQVRKLIWKAIWNGLVGTDFTNIGSVNTTGHQEVFLRLEAKKSLERADQQFLDMLCQKGIEGLAGLNQQSGTLIGKLSKTSKTDVSSKYSTLQLMYGLTDDQVLGIEGLTNVLYEISPRLETPNDTPSSVISTFNLARSEQNDIRSLLQKAERARTERIQFLRVAVNDLTDVSNEIKANGGIKMLGHDLIIHTGNGSQIDLNLKVKDPGVLAELRKMSVGASSYQVTGLDFEAKFRDLQFELTTLQNQTSLEFFKLFSEWSKWANAVADQIIDSFIGFPLFKEAKEAFEQLDATTQGSLYRDMDFEKIRSDILEFSGAADIDTSQISIEPDFYFWNDSVDGLAGNPLSDTDIQTIKTNTATYYNNALKDSTNWYQRKYLQKVDPQFREFLEQSRDYPEEVLPSIDRNTTVLPGLAQLKQQQYPHANNAFTRGLKNVENLRTSINAPVDDTGQKTPISGNGIEESLLATGTSSITQQPATPETMLDQSIESTLDSQAVQVANSGWIHPLPGARISSIIGFRKHPIHKDWSFHKGTDLTYNAYGQDLTSGKPVYATLSGEVLSVGFDSGGGNVIKIRSEYSDDKFRNVIHRYMHLQGFGWTSTGSTLKKGDWVNAGDIIGFAGNTGGSTGAHLHFDIYVEDDPSTWIYPFDYREEYIIETNPETNKSGYTVLRRPTFIPVAGTINPAMPSSGSHGFATGLSLFDLSTKRFQLDQQQIAGYRMSRAYPTIYLAFIEEDLDDEHIYKFDDYFSFASIVSLYCVKDREVPADYALMELTNLSGLLSNRKFWGTYNENDAIYNGTAAVDADRDNHAVINTDEEMRFESLVLREGIKVEIRLGYSNEPKNNEIVFIGRIASVQFSESDDIVQVEMQSLATELVQDIKGIDATEKYSGLFMSDARTGPLLEELIASPECVSFGFWERGSKDKNTNRDLLTNRWTWNPTPSTDNIFAPLSDDLDPGGFLLGKTILSKLAFGAASAALVGATTALLFGSSVFVAALSSVFGAPSIGIFGGAAVGNLLNFKGPFSKLSYYLSQSTIWDVFKEMEHRHPDCISSPVPYIEKLGGRTRMTMFFGNPDWLYFARDPKGVESVASASKKQQAAEIKQSLTSKFASEDDKLRAIKELANAVEVDDATLTKLKLALTAKDSDAIEDQFNAIDRAVKQGLLNDAIMNGAIKPFRDYHIVTSRQHIVANNIQAKSSNTFNAVTIRYAASSDEVKESEDQNNAPRIDSPEELTMQLDPLIPNEFVRESVYSYPNCQGDVMAKRYALSHLQKGCWNIYQGDLVVLGNPRIKPYDIVFIYDEYTDMYGPVQVRRVTHLFDMQQGFLTVITPDLVTTVTEGTMLSELQAMGLMAEHYLGIDDVLTPGTGMTDGVQVNPLKAFAAKQAMGIASFFGAKKLLFVTQFGNPVRIHPLIKQGQAMVAGFGPPGVRENEFMINDLHEWVITRWKASGQAMEDFQHMFENRSGLFNTRGSILGRDDREALATRRVTQE